MEAREAYLLVGRFTRKEGGAFYRSLYGLSSQKHEFRITSEREWRTLPFVTKEALLDVPFSQRLFTPLSALDHVRTSSGTSGRLPLFCPRTPLRFMDYRLEYHDFKKPILSYTVPIMPHWHEALQHSLGYSPRVISFDPKRAVASVRLAKASGVDSMSLFAFHIPLVAEHMKRAGINNDIRFIEIAGEACTRLLFNFMRDVFPNATILPFYGSSEVEDCPVGMPCRPITGEDPLSLYHAKPSQYHEIIDPENGAVLEPIAGAEGELVVTAYPGEPASFPLLRYRTGDIVRVVDERCGRHGSWSFTILGRTGMDFIKVPGGVLRADEVERVLRSMPERVSDRFELHISEQESPHGPLLVPVLYIEPRGETSLESLARDISGSLRVAPGFTYADGVDQKRYLPLSCEILRFVPGKKLKRIVRRP